MSLSVKNAFYLYFCGSCQHLVSPRVITPQQLPLPGDVLMFE